MHKRAPSKKSARTVTARARGATAAAAPPPAPQGSGSLTAGDQHSPRLELAKHTVGDGTARGRTQTNVHGCGRAVCGASRQPRGPQGGSSFRRRGGRPRRRPDAASAWSTSQYACGSPGVGATHGSRAPGTPADPGRVRPSPAPAEPSRPQAAVCTTGLYFRRPASLQGPSPAAGEQEPRPPTHSASAAAAALPAFPLQPQGPSMGPRRPPPLRSGDQ